jgi:protein TBF1
MIDPPIKQESFYTSGSGADPALLTPPSPSTKRRRSDENEYFGEKRQRIDTESSSNRPVENLLSEDFRAMLARAEGAVMQQHAPSGNELQAVRQEEAAKSCPPAAQNENIEPAGQISGFTSDPHLWMRIMSLAILESLVGTTPSDGELCHLNTARFLTEKQSVQILSTLQGPWLATVKVVQTPTSELGQTYATLKSLFDQTKKMYSQKDPFLSADELNIREPEHRATIRISNLATFASAVFGGNVGFYELNDHFIETFTPDGEPMSKEAGDLFLCLKTQMFLSAVSDQEEQERAKEDILEDFFPIGLDELLRSRHPGIELAESEIEFLRASQERRDYLMKEAGDIPSIRKYESQSSNSI